LLEGEELREQLNYVPFPSARALDYAQQFLRVWQRRMDEGSLIAISTRKSLYHYDGRVKILDFALAQS